MDGPYRQIGDGHRVGDIGIRHMTPPLGRGASGTDVDNAHAFTNYRTHSSATIGRPHGRTADGPPTASDGWPEKRT